MIHHVDIECDEIHIQLQHQRHTLTKEINDISQFFTTMTNYSLHPGNDKMIDALGKKYIL